MRGIAAALGMGLACLTAAYGEAKMEIKPYGGWDKCIHLTNGTLELVATTDVGPRVIRFGFVGGQNIFKEFDEQMGQTGGDAWRVFGGHRLWHAPESMPRTYAPDNGPVKYTWENGTLTLIQDVEASTGIQKEIAITMDANDPHVTVVHRLTNRNLWDVRLAPWALSVCAAGSRAIVPQEEYRAHADYLLPARPLVFWHYTDMTDPRWIWGKKYFQLKQDSAATTPQKVGLTNKQEWAAVALNGDIFFKRFAFEDGAEYADYGSNNEIFTNADMLELETLGPLTTLGADGGSAEHTEHWFLFKLDVSEDEADIDPKMTALARQTLLHLGAE